MLDFVVIEKKVDMKGLLLMITLAFASTYANAYISGIAIQTENTSTMVVYVNGKVYNKTPEKFVRIRSKPGLFRLEVRVLNPHDKRWYIVKKDVVVRRGYEFYYRMVFERGQAPRIEEIKQYPVYSRYFLNPVLYNRHPVT